MRQGGAFLIYKGSNSSSEEKLPKVAQQGLVESELTQQQNSTIQSVSPGCVPVTQAGFTHISTWAVQRSPFQKALLSLEVPLTYMSKDPFSPTFLMGPDT